MPTSLSRTERLILSNQYKILRAQAGTDKDEKESCDHFIEVLRNGYENRYEDLFFDVCASPVSAEVCNCVHDILDMFSAMQRTAIKHPTAVKVEDVSFSGFDGNNECDELAYLRFLNRQRLWESLRFSGFDKNDKFNSHCPLLASYKRMVAVWLRMPDKIELTPEQVSEILASGKAP